MAICTELFSSLNPRDFVRYKYLANFYNESLNAFVYTVNVDNVTVPIYHLQLGINPPSNIIVVGTDAKDLLLRNNIYMLIGIIGYGLLTEIPTVTTRFYVWWVIS